MKEDRGGGSYNSVYAEVNFLGLLPLEGACVLETGSFL